jgi:hypothetical protein
MERKDVKVFCFFFSKKKFFSEEKNQKTFMSFAERGV